jgi:hypothetical protein
MLRRGQRVAREARLVETRRVEAGREVAETLAANVKKRSLS